MHDQSHYGYVKFQLVAAIADTESLRGNADWFDDVDADGFSVMEVSSMLKELGYENPNIKILYKKPTSDLDKGLEPLNKSVIDLDQEDNSVVDGSEGSNACLETNECEALENDNAGLGTNEGSDDNEESDDTEESKDSDFECDIEDRIDDVDVDIEMFKKNTDPSVEWVGSTEPQPQVENNDQFVYEECDLEYFDSDIDLDDDEAERKKALRIISKSHKPVDGSQLKKRRELYLTNNDKKRVRAECRGLVPVFSNSGPSGESVPNVEGPSDGPSGSLSQPSEIDSNKKKTKKGGKPVVETLKCPWLMHSIKPKGENTWYVRVFRDTHTRLQSRKVRKCTTSFLAREIEQSIKPNPKIPLLALKDQIQKKYEIGVSKQKVFRAKQMAQEKVIGDHTTQYSLLRQYVLELKERNPDTTVKIDVERNFEPDSPTRKFRRIYVCLGALKNGFKSGQIDLLGLDGCFMSGPFHMQIITAVGVDPNNDDLELFRNSNFTFVTDRQKGVILALAETFPAAEHIYCLKHIYDKMKLQWRGKLFKELLWRCATTTTVTHFNRVMEEVKQANKDVYDWLKDIPPQHWARSHFSVTAIWNMAENGLEPGIPETWVHQNSPIILTPPDYHTPIGRPPKKRKKSVAKLYDGMVKDGKLSKAGKTVTCTKCSQKGHNSRSCKGQIGGQSTGTPMPNQRGGQSAQHNMTHYAPHVTVNPSAQHNMTHSAPHVTVNPSAQLNVT
ncbi:mutator type transposase [Tanacetum coccineum]